MRALNSATARANRALRWNTSIFETFILRSSALPPKAPAGHQHGFCRDQMQHKQNRRCYDRPRSPKGEKVVSSNRVAILPSSVESHWFSSLFDLG